MAASKILQGRCVDGARRFFSREKQVFLVGFSFNIPETSAQIQKPTKY